MKESLLYLALAIALGLGGPAQAISTTFAEWDEMTFEEQTEFISDRGATIYAWLKENEPAIAKCMYEKFEIGQNSKNPPVALVELNKQIKGVAQEDRPKYHVEALMANYIVDELCIEAKAQPSTGERTKKTK